MKMAIRRSFMMFLSSLSHLLSCRLSYRGSHVLICSFFKNGLVADGFFRQCVAGLVIKRVALVCDSDKQSSSDSLSCTVQYRTSKLFLNLKSVMSMNYLTYEGLALFPN